MAKPQTQVDAPPASILGTAKPFDCVMSQQAEVVWENSGENWKGTGLKGTGLMGGGLGIMCNSGLSWMKGKQPGA